MRKVGLQKPETLAHLVDCLQILVIELTRLLGSPTYSADVSSTLKAVIERASVVCDTNPGMFRHDPQEKSLRAGV